MKFLPDKLFTQLQFYHHLHKMPDLSNPRTFNEKIQWLKLYYRDDLLKTCADKYSVRQYVSSIIGKECLVPLIKVYESPDNIKFEDLPERFVLKLSHGSGWNIICRNKNTFDTKEALKKIRKWFRSDFFWVGREWAYKGLTPLIICEEYLDGGNGEPPLDYKFFCFNGTPVYVQIDYDRFINHTRALYDINWNKLPCSLEYQFNSGTSQRPACFDEMFEISAKLSKPFPFVRVDLYELRGKVLFGEMTFYPGKGVERFDPPEYDLKFGEMLDISSLVAEKRGRRG